MATTWNEESAAHLYRRAAFGASSAEVRRAVADGMDATVASLVDYESISNAALDARLGAANFDLTTLAGISRWWITRLLYTARPLEERMTLFWHDHFATSIRKVKDATLMLNQNALFRSSALGDFVDLTIAVSKDPAMLIWLDNATSRKDHPNENYGRELLELFTLGNGNYTEDDVQSSAKAFTGWSLNRTTMQFTFVDRNHDHTQKAFLGRTGDWNGDDIVRIACSQVAHAQLIATKLFAWFAHDDPEQGVVDRFAQIYLDAGNGIKPLVRAILTSDEMYSDKARWAKVKSPVDHAVTALRLLGVDNSSVPRATQSALSLEGETLFAPPDVSGWDQGLAWISSNALLTRMNFANSVAGWFDPSKFAGMAAVRTAADLVGVYLGELGPLTVAADTSAALAAYVATDGKLPSGTELTAKQRGLAHLVLSLPEWQMY